MSRGPDKAVRRPGSHPLVPATYLVGALILAPVAVALSLWLVAYGLNWIWFLNSSETWGDPPVHLTFHLHMLFALLVPPVFLLSGTTVLRNIHAAAFLFAFLYVLQFWMVLFPEGIPKVWLDYLHFYDRPSLLVGAITATALGLAGLAHARTRRISPALLADLDLSLLRCGEECSECRGFTAARRTAGQHPPVTCRGRSGQLFR